MSEQLAIDLPPDTGHIRPFSDRHAGIIERLDDMKMRVLFDEDDGMLRVVRRKKVNAHQFAWVTQARVRNLDELEQWMSGEDADDATETPSDGGPLD